MRSAVLFVALLVAKIILLTAAEKSLMQDHWRWSPQTVTWTNWGNFVLSNVLLFVAFASFATGSRQLPVRPIRLLNLGFVCAGLVFVIFSLHNGASNCFEPMLQGILPFKSVYAYWAIALFFGKPWVAVYLLGYALVYVVLWRKKAEWLSFYCLGGMAVLYVCLNCNYLVEDQRCLLVINCCGVASLVSATLNRRGALVFALQCLPIASLAVTWLVFRNWSANVASPTPYLMIILSMALLFFLVPAIPLKSPTVTNKVSHWLPFFFVAFVLLSNQWYGQANNYNKFIEYALALPHYLFGEVSAVVVLCCVMWWVGRQAPRLTLPLFDAAAILLILLAAADVKLDATISSRLDWNVLTQCDSVSLLLKTLRPYWVQGAVALLVVAGLYFSVVLAASRLYASRQVDYTTTSRRWVYLPIFLLVVGVFSSGIISRGKGEGFALTNVLLTSPLLPTTATKTISADEFSALVSELHLRHPRPAPQVKPSGKPMNVLLVVLESTYNKYLSLFGSEDETEPLLKKYKDRMELFPNFYSTFPSSFQARFTVLSGLYPTQTPVSHVNPHINAKSIIELLHDQGYVTSIYQSDPREYLHFNDYLMNRGVDHYYDCADMPGKEKFPPVAWGLPEQATMEAMTNQFAAQTKAARPFFTAYFPVAPHMPYDTPLPNFKKFPSQIKPFIKMDYSGEYKNTLLYIDWVLTSMLDALEREGLLDQTLVVITNDHGEMLGEEEGQLGHGWRLQPELCNTPLIILNPARKGYRVNYTLGSQVDLLPTISSLVGVELPTNEMYEGSSLYDESAGTQKIIYFNSLSQRALIRDGNYYWQESASTPPNVYTISFNETKTLFQKTQEKSDVTPLLDDFDRFQNSLIRHYQFYKKKDFARTMITTNSVTVSATLTR